MTQLPSSAAFSRFPARLAAAAGSACSPCGGESRALCGGAGGRAGAVSAVCARRPLQPGAPAQREQSKLRFTLRERHGCTRLKRTRRACSLEPGPGMRSEAMAGPTRRVGEGEWVSGGLGDPHREKRYHAALGFYTELHKLRNRCSVRQLRGDRPIAPPLLRLMRVS